MYFSSTCLIINDFCTWKSRCCIVQTSHGTKSLPTVHPGALSSQQTDKERIRCLQTHWPGLQISTQNRRTSSTALPSLHTRSPATRGDPASGFWLPASPWYYAREPNDRITLPPLAGSHFQGEVTLGNRSLKLSFNSQQIVRRAKRYSWDEDMKGSFVLLFKKRWNESSAPSTEGRADPLPSLPSGSAFHSLEILIHLLSLLHTLNWAEGLKAPEVRTCTPSHSSCFNLWLNLPASFCTWLSSLPQHTARSRRTWKQKLPISPPSLPFLHCNSGQFIFMGALISASFFAVLFFSAWKKCILLAGTKQQVIYLASGRLLSS